MTQAPVRASYGRIIVILAVLGKMIGLKESECGQMGVSATTSEVGWIIEPPHDRLYAVLPVGVEMRTPSPYTMVRSVSLM